MFDYGYNMSLFDMTYIDVEHRNGVFCY